MTQHAEQREVRAELARADLPTHAELRERQAVLADTRLLGRIDSALWFHTQRHHRIHPANLEACDLCAVLFELAVLLRLLGEQP